MSKLKIFLETTLFNRYYDIDREGHRETVMLFNAIGEGVYEGYASFDVIEELEKANDPKRANMIALIEKYDIVVLEANDDTHELAGIYIQNKVIPKRFIMDATHIAIASVYKLDDILSYNFSHINNDKTKMMTEEINRRLGYKYVKIRAPLEVLKDEKKT